MKEIINWEAVLKDDEKGKEKIALPLPGCIIKGDIEGKMVAIEVMDIDTSNLVIIAPNGLQYLLSGASRNYLKNLEICIQFGERENGEER